MYQTIMKTMQLGDTGLEITRVGFGAWAIGGGNWEFGWGPQDDDASIAAIHHALEQGINWIDTATAYGFGRSEQIVGRALQDATERPYVFTKCSLIEREVEREILPFAQRERIGVIVYSPMGSGMLSGGMTRERIERLPEDDWRKHDTRFNEPQLSRNLDLVARLAAVAERYDTTPGAVTVAWALRNPAVDGAIVGFRRPDQVDPILHAASLELTDQDIAEIEGSTR